jgi:hypothetical protein
MSPRKSRTSIQAEADRRLSEADRAVDRFVDLQLDWTDYDGRRIARFGGKWDRTERCYVGDADTSRVVKMHPGQIPAAEWFYDWLAQHSGAKPRDPHPIFHALFAGGRRGGKTTLAVDALVAYAVAIPESENWVVTVSDAFYDEPIDYIERSMPEFWYRSLGAPHWSFYLVNGSSIEMRSGYTPRKLKRGRADLVMINEAQQIKKQAMTTVEAATIDVGGLVISAANPPDVGDEGTWVAELAAEAGRGQRKHARYFFFDPEKNPEIDQVALKAKAESMSRREYRVQILGEFLLPPDAVLHEWDNGPDGNEMPVPELGVDVTEAFTARYEGRAARDIIGVDIQNFPWHAAVRLRVFDNPQFPGVLEQALMWGVGEVFLEKGDEGQLAEALKDHEFRGELIDPATALVVMDASGRWQQATRDTFKQKKEYKGRGSMDIFRRHGFLDVVPPDRYMKANPEVMDRVRAANARICTYSGRRLLFVDPLLCPETVASIRAWRTAPTGLPSRRQNAAHAGDALTYVLWRFWPRRGLGDKVEGDGGAPSSQPTLNTRRGPSRYRSV